MHGLIAATGAATKRFDDLAAAMSAGSGEPCVELTMPSAQVRLGLAGAGAVAAGTTAGARAAAVLGSPVQTNGAGLAIDILDRFVSAPGSILDGRGEDLVALVADEDTATLTLGAAPGNQRLFVADVDGGLLVATHLAPLAAALGADLALDRSYEDFLLGFGFLPDGRTVYDRIRIAAAGEVRTVPDGAVHAVEPAPVAFPDIDLDDPAAVSSALHDVFIAALEQQAGTRTRHAVLLGGFDSALVAAGLRRLGHDVDCYTFGFDDPAFEQRNVGLVTNSIGASQAWVQFTPALIGELLADFDRSVNQPGPQPHYQLHTVHACGQIAADGHDHVFTGDGCDAAFFGYPMVNQRARIVARLGSIPEPVLRAAIGGLGKPFAERHLGQSARLARSLLGNILLEEPARGHLPTRYLDEYALARLRADAPPVQAEPIDATRERLAVAVAGLDATRRAFHGNGLTGQSKAKVEGAVGVTGVAEFSPFLHPLVKGFAQRLPMSAFRPEGSKAGASGKVVLAAMARENRLLPDAVIDMPKQSPVDSPIDTWYAGPLRPVVDEMLRGLPFAVNRSYIDELLTPKRAEAVLRERYSLGHHVYQAIGLLCSYAAFTRRAHL